ncbi:hypothetical protein AAFF_G00259730 [Aldrovandia affinis]|uniref:Uncharacterized protein n=1 Tax=Aldrovandia affinis TaxID=143900 RepID=A0AAD7RCN8_9TELE|nr:hypothetical protein AAFF_G00259730 [Aldrovandia affinis]
MPAGAGGGGPKEAGDKRPVSAHSVFTSLTRHTSVKTKLENPQYRKAATAGRSKSFSNHRPQEPGVAVETEPSSQDIEAVMASALSELCELERQSSARPAPDVVLDTLEQLKAGPGPRGPPSEPASPLHPRLGPQHALQRSSSSASDGPSAFRPAPCPAHGPAPCPSPSLSHREPRPPATRPKPVLFPKTSTGPGSPTTPPPPRPPPSPPPPTPPMDQSCPSSLLQ